MDLALHGFKAPAYWFVASLLAFLPRGVSAQSCQTSSDMETPIRAAIITAAQRYFEMAAKGDVASMRQGAIPTLAADFGGIEATIKKHGQSLAASQATVKASFLLDSADATPNQRTEFYCGVFGKNGQTANSAAFYFDNLPSGRYAVVLLDATSPQGRTMFSEVLQQVGTDWKLGGLYVKSAQFAGHDGDWFLARARDYKAKRQVQNAWLYFEQSMDLASRGMHFMSTQTTESLYGELDSVQPSDLPTNGKTVDLVAGANTYKLSAVYPWMIGNDLDLLVQHRVADASNSNQMYQENAALVKALIAKYPEFREAFAGVEAVAVDSSGRDYGTLLAMKDIK
ncbi:MAG TPA: hypothetical protein VE377_19630 [Candidatus Dormibacteraeota bacterium]|nr:hypothetical protein [Candidatus Dormibacteraeota bacterium]